MPATDPQSLLSQASCFNCYGNSPAQIELMKLVVLVNILKQLNPMAATDPKSLLSQASCYDCFGSSPGLISLMQLALLAQIAQTSTTLAGVMTCGNFGGNAPNFTPASGCALAVDTSNGRPWWYYNGAWN